MPDLFKEIIPSILQTKKSVIKDEVDLKDYVPFVVNRALSYHMDCVLYANEMNVHCLTDKDMQYQYLLNSIRPMKRKFAPWQKARLIRILNVLKPTMVILTPRPKRPFVFLQMNKSLI